MIAFGADTKLKEARNDRWGNAGSLICYLDVYRVSFALHRDAHLATAMSRGFTRVTNKVEEHLPCFHREGIDFAIARALDQKLNASLAYDGIEQESHRFC